MRASLLLALVLCACTRGTEAPRPDVLLVTIDTLRADHCSTYGYERETTPALTQLAEEGVLFEVAYAPVGATCPSHATLFTAKHPPAHGLVRNGLPLGATERTLAEVLAENGYATAAFVSSFPVSRRFGFDQGFEHFDDRFDPERDRLETEKWTGEEVTAGFDRAADETAAAALAWLDAEAPPERPIFVWVHLFDPHAPCEPPAPFDKAFGSRRRDPKAAKIARYDGAVAFADDAWRRVLERIDARARDGGPLIVVTADHGEGLWDHGYAAHNRFTYEEELRVPLVLRWHGCLPADVRLDQPAHLVDLAPTIAGLLKIPELPADEGLDLSTALFAAEPPDRERPLFLQRPFYPSGRPRYDEKGAGHGVRVGRWKYFEAPEEGVVELYDLERDPGETRNVAAEHPERVRELAALLADWLARQRALAPEAGLTERPEDLEGLRALGYLDGLEEGE